MNMSLDLRRFGVLLLSFAFLCSNQCKKANTYTKYGNAYSLTSYTKDSELSTVSNVDVIRQGKMDNDNNKALNTKAVSDNNLPYQRPLPPLPVVDKPNQNNSSISGIGNSLSIVSSRGGSKGYVSNEIDEESIYEEIDNYVVSSLHDKTYELITVSGRQTETGSDDEFLRTIEPLHNNLQHERPLLPMSVIGNLNQSNASASGIYNSFNKRVVIPDPDYAWLEGTRPDNSEPYFLRIPPVPPRPTRRSSNRKMNFSSVTRKITIWLPLKGLVQRNRR